MFFLLLLILSISLFYAYRYSSQIGIQSRAKLFLVLGLFSLLLSAGQCLTVVPAGNVGVVD
ncbi:MAG: hypothetical protein O3A55_07270, partial [Bacteroidetes bacterium]|nr:hypothetical protein [Bacteroidota bacterium]